MLVLVLLRLNKQYAREAVELDSDVPAAITSPILRRHVVLVDQEPFVFHASIEDNIRYARPEASDAEVERAAQTVAGGDWIRSLPPSGQAKLSAATYVMVQVPVAPAGTLADGETFTTLELKINFLKPVWSGRLTATARVVKPGRTVGLVECDVRDDDGHLVARASSTCVTLRGDAAVGR